MARRRKIPISNETWILTKSARRCALCFGLKGDLTERHGQIAHIDHDPANNLKKNLVWLCLEHHDKYDGRTSQSKGYTQAELIKYRAQLYMRVKNGIDINTTGISQRREDQRQKRIEKVVEEHIRLWNDSTANVNPSKMIRAGAANLPDNSELLEALHQIELRGFGHDFTAWEKHGIQKEDFLEFAKWQILDGRAAKSIPSDKERDDAVERFRKTKENR